MPASVQYDQLLLHVIQVRHNRCSTPQVFELERQQDVRSPVFYRLERVPGSKEMTGFIKLKEFNALAKRDLLTGMLSVILAILDLYLTDAIRWIYVFNLAVCICTHVTRSFEVS